MYACTLHQLHDARHKDILSVTNTIDFHFLTPDVVIYQYRLFLIDFYRCFQILAKLLLFCHNLHGSSTQNKTWTYQHRIPYGSSGSHSVFNIGHCLPFWLWNGKLCEKLFKGLPIFCFFNGFAVCSDNGDTSGFQRLCQINGSLSAQRGNDALRLLQFNDIHYVFHTEGLKIQFIRSRIIGRNCFGIIVDDNGFISGVPDGFYGMDCGIVKFYSLPDSDRTGTKHQNFLSVSCYGFILLFVSGIKIRNITVKFRSTGINHFIHRK